MKKELLAYAMLISAIISGCSQVISQYQPLETCTWTNASSPEATIQIKETNAIGIVSADLLWKGKAIRSLLMGQFNGYGSLWWSYQDEDGKPIGGGPLVAFLGDRPRRAVRPNKTERDKNKKALLVGLSPDLYYTDQRENIELLRAGEDFWYIPKQCRFF